MMIDLTIYYHVLLLDHQNGCKENLQTLLPYPNLCHDYLTQSILLHTDL